MSEARWVVRDLVDGHCPPLSPVAITKVVSFDFVHSRMKIVSARIHHDLSSAEHVRSIAIGQHGARLLLDQKDPQAIVSGRSHGNKEASHDQWSQPDRQFVGKKDARLSSKGTGQCQHLLFAAREKARFAVQEGPKLREPIPVPCRRHHVPNGDFGRWSSP